MQFFFFQTQHLALPNSLKQPQPSPQAFITIIANTHFYELESSLVIRLWYCIPAHLLKLRIKSHII